MAGKYALMWSGGKDSALALQRAGAANLEVARLINFYDAATGRVRFHATRVEMLEAQARALGIDLVAIATSWPEMEDRLVSELAALGSAGFSGVVLGDIHLADVRAWYEERVLAAGLQHVEPLWAENPAHLIKEFVTAGGRAVVTCVELSRLDVSWLGRVIDERFVEEIIAIRVDPCGENGEYHSFAFDGPMFARPVSWHAGEVRSEGGFSQLDLTA